MIDEQTNQRINAILDYIETQKAATSAQVPPSPVPAERAKQKPKNLDVGDVIPGVGKVVDERWAQTQEGHIKHVFASTYEAWCHKHETGEILTRLLLIKPEAPN